jgi:hypothetical protein
MTKILVIEDSAYPVWQGEKTVKAHGQRLREARLGRPQRRNHSRI